MATFFFLCQVAAVVSLLLVVPYLAAVLRDWFTDRPVRVSTTTGRYPPRKKEWQR